MSKCCLQEQKCGRNIRHPRPNFKGSKQKKARKTCALDVPHLFEIFFFFNVGSFDLRSRERFSDYFFFNTVFSQLMKLRWHSLYQGTFLLNIIRAKGVILIRNTGLVRLI